VLTAKNGPLGWAYAPNASFAANKNFSITVQELDDAVRRNCRGPRWAELLARLEGGTVDTTPENPTADLGTTLGIQRALAQLGYPPGPVDGIPGPLTRGAVVAFQRSKGLEVDGIVGPLTRAALAAALATP